MSFLFTPSGLASNCFTPGTICAACYNLVPADMTIDVSGMANGAGSGWTQVNGVWVISDTGCSTTPPESGQSWGAEVPVASPINGFNIFRHALVVTWNSSTLTRIIRYNVNDQSGNTAVFRLTESAADMFDCAGFVDKIIPFLANFGPVDGSAAVIKVTSG